MKHVRGAAVGIPLVWTAVVGSPTAVAGPAPTAAIGFHDRGTDTTGYVNLDRRFNTASIVKVLIATALQWRAQQDGRPLGQQEVDTATTMITSADATASNEAANELWRQLRLEQSYVQEVLDIMGLFGTTPHRPGGPESRTTSPSSRS